MILRSYRAEVFAFRVPELREDNLKQFEEQVDELHEWALAADLDWDSCNTGVVILSVAVDEDPWEVPAGDWIVVRPGDHARPGDRFCGMTDAVFCALFDQESA